MKINPNEITKEMFEEAAKCETAEELMELAKSNDIDLTKEEAEAYLDELSMYELDDGELKQVAGGKGGKKPDGGHGEYRLPIRYD